MSKKKQVNLSVTQVSHLIYGAVRNLVDLKTFEFEGGYRFLLILDCLNPDDCIPNNQEPETEEELIDIAGCHGVLELYDFFDNVLAIKDEVEEKYFRAYDTIEINKDNMADFVNVLTELDDYWNDLDRQIEEEADFSKKALGKNFVPGNETVN